MARTVIATPATKMTKALNAGRACLLLLVGSALTVLGGLGLLKR